MFKMGSHCSFRYLKHKLWPKKGPGVELSVWLPTTKSRESTSSRCLIRECNMALKSSWRELQLCFKPHCNQRSARKVMGLQSPRSLEKNSHLDVGSVESHRVYYKGEGGGFPQVRVVVSLMCSCCPWFVLAPRVLQLCTNHFVWVVCRPVWMTKACQLFLVPSRSSNTPFYPSKCCELGSVLRLLLFRYFLLGLTFEPFKELGVRQIELHKIIEKKLDAIAWANFYDQSVKNNQFVNGKYEIIICITEIFTCSKFGLNIYRFTFKSPPVSPMLETTTEMKNISCKFNIKL